jgi:hypothetical protein
MVIVTGPINQVRAMITGRYDIHLDPPAPGEPPAVAATSAPARADARAQGVTP